MISIYQALLYYYPIYLSYPICHILSTSSIFYYVVQCPSKQNVFQLSILFKRNVDSQWTLNIFDLKVIWQHNICMLYRTIWRLFKWISNVTNRKWRDRTNEKNVGKIKMWILCMDVIYGESGGSQVNVQRTFSVTHFEFWVIPNKIYHLHVSQEKPLHCS